MVGRAFLEALKFGAAGGPITAWAPVLISPPGPNDVNVMTEGVIAILLSTIISALIGTMVAYIALVLAGMSADTANRGVGVVVAFCVTFAASFVMIWFWALAVAAYAAIVAWFRLPRIVG